MWIFKSMEAYEYIFALLPVVLLASAIVIAIPYFKELKNKK